MFSKQCLTWRNLARATARRVTKRSSQASVYVASTTTDGKFFSTINNRQNIISSFQEKKTFDESCKRTFFGSLFAGSNPFTEALLSENETFTHINYSKLKPVHVKQAADEMQAKYESDLKVFEESLCDELDYETFIRELERISRPLITLQNHVMLFSCVKRDPTFDEALREANSTIDLKHEYSSAIRDHLLLLQKGFDDNANEEHSRVVNHLLRKHRINGSTNEVVEEVNAIRSKLESVQSDFLFKSSLTMEEHGKMASSQELLPMMYSQLALQQQLALVLGYDTYADYSLDYHNAMAKSVNEIQAIHGMFEQLRAVEKFSSDEFQSAYIETLKKTSDLDLNQYFEMNHVLSGLFDLCSALFGIKIEEQNSNVNGWHLDVRLYHIYDMDSGLELGSFYLDPFRRQHKDRGCFMAPLQYQNERNIPVAVVSLDVKAPMWDDAPIELEVQNVIDIFHEFGHLLEHVLADVEYGAFSGAQEIENDASETISQFMEYWLFHNNGFSKISSHIHSKDMISPDTMKLLLQERQAKKAVELLHRLFLGQLEVEISSKFDPNGDESIIALQRKCAERFCPHHIPPKGNIDPLVQLFQSNANGKNMMQYRYLWSEIMSADLFQSFSKSENLPDTGRKLKKEYLEKGNSVPTYKAVEAFQGRSAQADALVSRYELIG